MKKHLKTTLAVLIVALAIVAGILIVGSAKNNGVDNNPIACTMDAKICPDGTAVGRTGPRCEFAACPAGAALDESGLVETYVRANIATLAPEPAVLGGTWYVVEISVNTTAKTGIVTYEDGHIQGKASFKYVRTGDTIAISNVVKSE